MDLTEALKFARDHKQGVLATIRANGRPQLSNIMYVPDEGDTFLISITDSRAKTANLRRDPRASLYVLGDNFWQYVVIEATAELSPVAAEPNDATVEALIRYYEAGSGAHPNWDDYRAAMVADQRLALTLRPERAYGMIAELRPGPQPAFVPAVLAQDRAVSAWAGVAGVCGRRPLSDSSTSWERSSTRTSSSLALARTASSSMIMQ